MPNTVSPIARLALIFVPYAAPLGLVSLFGAAGCSSNSATEVAPKVEGPQADAGVDAAAEAEVRAEALFRKLEPALIQTCGGTNGVCHVSGTFHSAPKILAMPDAYASAKAYRGVIPASRDADDSILLLQVEHTGPALVNSPQLFADVRNWIAHELDQEPLPAVEPFTVRDGFNAIDLGPLAPGMAGAKLTMLATVRGDILSLTAMKLVAPEGKRVTLESPFFIVVPEEGPPVTDPANRFAGEVSADAGQTVTFFNGSLIVSRWAATNRLKFIVTKLTVEDPIDPGAGAWGCKSVATFTSSAVPAFQTNLGGGTTCLTCHGGGDEVAMFAMDLSAVGTDNARACAQALHWADATNPQDSVLVRTPTGRSNPNHAIQSVPQSVVDGLVNWMRNE